MIGHRVSIFFNYLSIPAFIASTVYIGYSLLNQLGLGADLLLAGTTISLIFLLGLYSERVARIINTLFGPTVQDAEERPFPFLPGQSRTAVFGSGFRLRRDEAKDKLRTIKQAAEEIEQQIQEISDIIDETGHKGDQGEGGDAPTRNTLS